MAMLTVLEYEQTASKYLVCRATVYKSSSRIWRFLLRSRHTTSELEIHESRRAHFAKTLDVVLTLSAAPTPEATRRPLAE